MSTRGRTPLTSGFSEVREAARQRLLLNISTAIGLASIAGIFGAAVWAVAGR